MVFFPRRSSPLPPTLTMTTKMGSSAEVDRILTDTITMLQNLPTKYIPNRTNPFSARYTSSTTA